MERKKRLEVRVGEGGEREKQEGRQTDRQTLKFRGLLRVSNCFIQVQCKLCKVIYPRGGWVSVSRPLERAPHL